ncbi:MAG: ABC transporter permease [Veillonella sp.]|nr:ABC transporter permease [Veillonella sp.]
MNRQKPYTLYAMLVLAALWIVFFLCAPYIAPFDPETTSIADRLQDISSTHLLGTDQLGRDVWSRILYGGKASLGIAFTIIGISGLSRLIDLVLGFPNMVIAIAFIGIMGPSITNVIISLCITKWAEYARITRGLVQIERHAEYITFARMSGASNLRILWRYILPNVLPPLVIVIIQHLGDAIILVASFSLIGIGVQPPDPEWGAILLSSRDFLQTAPWLLIYPGLAIFITVVLFNYIGDALRDALDVSR